MLSGLPESIYPCKLAASGERLAGRLDYGRFYRLKKHSNQGEALCDLAFFENEEGRVCIEGQVEAALELVCQRCLEPIDQRLTCEVRLTVVHSDEVCEFSKEAPLASRDELVLADETPISLIELVEDELLLSLALTPMHPQGDCQIEHEYRVPHDLARERPSPFAVLSELKRRS